MSNSGLVNYTKASPNNSGKRKYTISRITPHCVVGQLSVESLGSLFAKSITPASSNYGIGPDGRVGMYVEEKYRSWCSSSSDNDNRAVTIECASDTKSPYEMKSAVYAKLVKLCVDICKRNGKNKLIWFGNKEKTLAYKPATNEMILTVHRWFANKSCPGDWLYSRLGDLADEVTKQLTADKKMIYLQLGAFRKRENANRMIREFKNEGFTNLYVVPDDGLFKVRTGPYKTKAKAVSAQKKYALKNYTAIIV